jgi:hypothetical protein
MGARFPTGFSNVVVNNSIPTTTQTFIVQLPTGLILPYDNAAVVVTCTLQWTPGTGTVTYGVNLYRAPSTTAFLVQAYAPIVVTAGNLRTDTWQWLDVNPGAALNQYAVSISQNAATGNGNVNFAALFAAAF